MPITNASNVILGTQFREGGTGEVDGETLLWLRRKSIRQLYWSAKRQFSVNLPNRDSRRLIDTWTINSSRRFWAWKKKETHSALEAEKKNGESPKQIKNISLGMNPESISSL
jgi:hypothetical protein